MPSPSPPAILGADQQDNRIRLFNPFAPGDRKPDLWSYPEASQPAHKYKPTDAKRVDTEGTAHVLAAYHSRVCLVRFSDHKVLRDFPSLSSCHSAELLPDGTIASANSNHGILRHHHSDSDHTDLKLPYAHGVTWDRERNCLWAVGDKLYRYRLQADKLTLAGSFPLPDDPTGHELFPLRSEPKLLVSNNLALYLFDIPTSRFEKISALHEIKSASQHIDGTIWATDPANIEGSASYQTHTITRIRPAKPPLAYTTKGSKFYKARWWHPNTFSYEIPEA